MEKPIPDDVGRRKHPRVNCHWSGRMQNTKRQMVRCTVRNVSQGGVGVTTQMMVKKGDKILLEFKGIHHEKQCDVRAICIVAFVVVKGSEYDVGLKFNSKTDGFKDFLTNYINGRTVGE